MDLIMKSPRFGDISAKALGEAFRNAAKNDQIAATELIMKSPRFGDISADYLGEAFCAAVSLIPVVLQYIMESSRFKEIPTEALQRAFVLATERDLFVAEDLIKQSSRFSEISN